MHTQHFAINDSGERQEIKYLTASFPDGGIAVLCLAFFVKAVYLGNLTRLVVASDKSDLVRVSVRSLVRAERDLSG